MNLKTHTVYPETQVDHETGKWISRLLDGEGAIAETFTGKIEKDAMVAMNRAAGKAAHIEINKVADQYLIPEKAEVEGDMS